MPVITIKYNETVDALSKQSLAEATQKIVSDVTGIEDVFVYADAPAIQIKTAPVEIFIQMSDFKIKNAEELTAQLKLRLSEWKEQHSYHYLINLTLIPIKWNVEIGI